MVIKNYSKLREKAIIKTKEIAKKELTRRDNLIVSAVKTIDIIDKTSSLLGEQAKEWFSTYWPELREQNIEDYLEKAVNGKKPADSMGAELQKKDIEMMQGYIQQVIDLRKERKAIEKYLEEIMKEEAPNITAIIGAVIGARMISAAGSLKKLAEFPSSTVQVLGAEKALFAHLKKGVKPPKYGILFQFPKIRSADREKRGKIARRVSAKVSLAAKLDYFKGTFIGDDLAEKLNKEISKI